MQILAGSGKVRFMPVILSGLGILSVGAEIYYLLLPVNDAETNISLRHKDPAVVDLGRVVYAEN